MKIQFNVPQVTKLLRNDAPIIRIVKLAIPAFILLSSITVFYGVKFHLSDYLEGLSSFIRVLSYSLSYILFSLAPDVLNVTVVAYMVRSFLKGHYNDVSSKILLVCCLILSLGLTKYSYKMSKTSATSAAYEMSNDVKQIDLVAIDTFQSAKVNAIRLAYEADKQTIQKSVDQSLLNNETYYSQLIEAKKEEIVYWEKRRKPKNTLYVDTKIKRVKKEVVGLEAKKLKTEKSILSSRNSKLEDLLANRKKLEDELFLFYKDDRSAAKEINEGERIKSKSLLIAFESEISWIAGKAVFIILILSMIKEILYHRNEIEITPIMEPFDFSTNALREILMLPFIAASRYAINKTRKIYSNLPNLEKPVRPSDVHDVSALLPKIIKEKPEDKEESIEGTQRSRSMNGEERKSVKSLVRVANGKEEQVSVLLNADVKNVIGKEAVYENRIYDTPVTNLRSCLHCKKDYQYKHHKQKYCSDDCRKKAWELRNGRKLKLKAKKS